MSTKEAREALEADALCPICKTGNVTGFDKYDSCPVCDEDGSEFPTEAYTCSSCGSSMYADAAVVPVCDSRSVTHNPGEEG